MTSSDEVGRSAETLRAKVGHFLVAMANPNETERRRYEQISGAGCRARLHVSGRQPAEMNSNDISCGGVALLCDCAVPAGTEVRIDLPDVQAPLLARVARAEQGAMALFFCQDAASLEQLDRVLDAMDRRAHARAA